MIEVRIPIPVEEYLHIYDDLSETFTKNGIICVLSADTVIRTWAGLRLHEWFDQQGQCVEWYMGWGEIDRECWDEPMLAATSAEFVDELDQPYVVMTFRDEACEFSDYPEEAAQASRNLALMFKLAHGGR